MSFVKRLKLKIQDIWDGNLFLSSFIIFSLAFVLFSSIYLFNPGISTADDHFFYFKHAYLLRTEGWSVVHNFDWIYFTRNGQGIDEVWIYLFQIALIPFTYIDDKMMGLKLSDIFWASSCLSLLYYTLRKMEAKFPLFFMLFLITSPYFFARILSGRPLVLSVALVFLQIYLAVEKKYLKFFTIALLYVLWHPTTFFFPILIVSAVEAGRYLAEKKFYVRNFFAGLLAPVIGLAFSPGFPENFFNLFKKIISMHASMNDKALLKIEGAELYVKDPLSGLLGSNTFFLLAVLGVFMVIYYYIQNRDGDAGTEEKKSDQSGKLIPIYSLFIFLLVSMLGAIAISGRFFDYYFPAVIFLGSLILAKMTRDRIIVVSKKPFKYIASGMFVFFIAFSGNMFLDKNVEIYAKDVIPIEKTAKWIEERSNPKELIFLQNWSYFTTSFFFNSKNVYVAGMEPRDFLDYSPKLYWKWYNITNYAYYCEEEGDCGDELREKKEALKKKSQEDQEVWVKENSRKIILSIRNDFGSRFVLSDSTVLNGALMVNEDMIAESFEAKSEINGGIMKAFKLN